MTTATIVLLLIMFLISSVGFALMYTSRWALGYFGLSCFEQVVFHMKVPLEGANTEFLGHWLKKCVLRGVFLGVIFALPCHFTTYRALYPIIVIGLFIVCIAYGMVKAKIAGYIADFFRKTDLYEKYYADGKAVAVTFPEKKRNLILLYVESMETTYTSKENGGNYHADLLKEITDLAKEHLNFSHQEALGGAHCISGTGWTTGGLVSQSAGIPLCIPFSLPNFSEKTEFMPGSYSLGDILKDAGYEQEYLIGSDAVFGGRKFFYDKHGAYHIFDLDEAKRLGKIPQDYHEFWGYEDEKLFTFAKEEATKLSQTGKPFNLTILTVDTHHPDGYVDQDYKNEYPEQLSNIIRGNARRVGDFVAWLKEQPFYEDTTIVIAGDHLSMAEEYIRDTYDNHYNRTMLNVFINAVPQPGQTKNRQFTGFDMYPTIISALGAKIPGDRLGLGVDLFSDTKTIAEEHTVEWLNKEIRKQSRYYKQYIVRGNEDF